MKSTPLSRYAPILLTLALAAGCGGSGEEASAPAASSVQQRADAPDVLGVIPYFELTDTTGQPYGLEELRGQVWVAGFVPVGSAGREHGEEMSRLQKTLAGSPWAEGVRLVSFAADPAQQTSEELAKVAGDASADAGRWKLLTGSPVVLGRVKASLDQARQVAGITGGGAALAVLDRLGRIRGLYSAEGADEALLERAQAVAAEIKPLPYPADIMNPPWLEERREAQLASAKTIKARHDFSFTDRIEESGITFVDHVTEDSGKHYKTNHYDHGNGVVAADVDGDGLLDLYFVTQLGSNELWRNLGGGRFENITEQAGVALADRVGVTAAFGDVDNDGDPDLFVTTVRFGNVLFLNDGSGHFTDVTEEAGVSAVAHSSGAVFFDYDRDGLLDLFVANVGRYTTDEVGPGGYYIGYQVAFDGHLKPERAERSILYHNLGNHRFEDVSEKMGLVEKGWNGDASILDVNEDGWPDLFITDMQGHDEYYENEGGKRFKNRSREVFPATPFGTMGVQVFDFDNDGKMDIYLTDMHTDMVRLFAPEEEKHKLPAAEMMTPESTGSDGNHVLGNAFFQNQGGGRFEEISDLIGAENYWPWGLSKGDLNADGYEDVFIASSMSYGWRFAVNSLLLNENGQRFRDAEFILGVEPRKGGINGEPWFELDCSGADSENFHCNGRTGKWQVWGALGSRSSLIWDLDGDGDLDVVTNEFNAAPQVLISDLADSHQIHYLEVDLEGTRSNRDGIGAKVVVTAGGKTYTQVLDGKSGYLSFCPLPLYFGLGDAATVDSITVTWPSGKTQTLTGPIDSNQMLKIVEEG